MTLQSSQDSEWRIIEGEPMEIKTEFGSAFGPILFPMDDALLVHRTVSSLHYAGGLSVALPAWDGLPDTAWWLR